MRIGKEDALIVVDVQNDFLPGGALPAQGGEQIVPVINRLLPCFETTVLTRDWHPANHASFSTIPAFTDKSWPAHCVQNTWGAEFHPDLRVAEATRVLSKGTAPEKEAYSGFQESDLAVWLRQKQIQRVFIAGLVTEYCVKTTALDARKEGFEVFVIQDAVKGVNHPLGSAAAAEQAMLAQGVHFITSQELPCH
jgi:nicotinamidase/pyrazinamidase